MFSLARTLFSPIGICRSQWCAEKPTVQAHELSFLLRCVGVRLEHLAVYSLPQVRGFFKLDDRVALLRIHQDPSKELTRQQAILDSTLKAKIIW